MLAGEPARAISINDPVALAAGGIANYYDAGNQFPNVVSLFSPGVPGVSPPGSQCTGTLINSRTILTAAHCFAPNEFGIPSISFTPIAGPGTAITSFVRHPGFIPSDIPGPNDIAVISLARPITTISPVTIAGLVPAPGTVLVSAGYGMNGIGTNCCNPVDDKRRNMTVELGAFAPSPFPESLGTQPLLLAQFRDPSNPNSTIPNNNPNIALNPNFFNLTVPTSALEGSVAPGDSGGPVFIQTPRWAHTNRRGAQRRPRRDSRRIPHRHGVDVTEPIPRLGRAE